MGGRRIYHVGGRLIYMSEATSTPIHSTHIIERLSDEAMRIVLEENGDDIPAHEGIEAWQRTVLAMLETFLERFETHHGPAAAKQLKAQMLVELEHAND